MCFAIPKIAYAIAEFNCEFKTLIINLNHQPTPIFYFELKCLKLKNKQFKEFKKINHQPKNT